MICSPGLAGLPAGPYEALTRPGQQLASFQQGTLPPSSERKEARKRRGGGVGGIKEGEIVDMERGYYS